MKTHEFRALDARDEKGLDRAVNGFVHVFHRLPNQDELLRLRRAQHRVHLRLPARGRRRLASVIATL